MSCGLDPTMPPQYESTWESPTLPSLPGPEDFHHPLDDFSLFEEPFLNLNFEDPPLFNDLLPECDLPDLLGELSGPFAVRHDCMWAGSCPDKERHNKASPAVEDRLHQDVPVQEPEPCLKDTTQDVLSPSVPLSKTPKVKCNQRSILRTNLNVSAPNERTALAQEDSDDSGRPPTPDSMASDTDTTTDLKHDVSLYDYDCSEEEDTDEAAPVSDVTGQTVRTSYHQQGYESAEALHHRGHASRFDSRPQQTVVSNHFFNDHSYHLSKTDVNVSIPGNLTPSDSEDEIDVVSVCGEKGTSSRSSSQGALPTNPSARDRRAIQQTMASAMKKGYSSYSSYLPGRQPSGKLARMEAERQRQRERKRRAQERDDSSEEDSVRYGPSKKRAKHSYKHAYKHASKRGHSFKMSSSDSEPDSCEKRSLHNNMERQRRVDLRNAFEDLRVVVPALSPNPRAAKVVILKEASHYCHQLTADSRSLQQESSLLERERERLLARVSYLRKQVASMRMGM